MNNHNYIAKYHLYRQLSEYAEEELIVDNEKIDNNFSDIVEIPDQLKISSF